MLAAEMKQWIKRELPIMFREDAEIHQFILELTRGQFADKRETESRFDRLLDELRRDREEQSRKWEENRREQNRKWEENQQELKNLREAQERKWEAQERKWEANQRTIQQALDRLDAFEKRFDASIGAIGSRWGFQAEESFRNALASILEGSFGVQVLNVIEFDETGEVFGHPDQVELDVIIKNGLLILCELKSSMSRADVYVFDRKVTFYERLHQRTATRRIAITPMIRDDARRVAKTLGIEVYSYPQDVTLE
ncbi:hypothetical protein CSA56_17250 [candidate division KSB3 bacterium]|uniref:DUF3782 domain-containing protein n=1 Tax=candidate division KSB3 bacterium TaxID=2044937 RepID=A0A2G6K875_9BACT|nr:MAG: hypothetical protein CSA56_17250 [candidate division KSB3 bacterium]